MSFQRLLQKIAVLLTQYIQETTALLLYFSVDKYSTEFNFDYTVHKLPPKSRKLEIVCKLQVVLLMQQQKETQNKEGNTAQHETPE